MGLKGSKISWGPNKVGANYFEAGLKYIFVLILFKKVVMVKLVSDGQNVIFLYKL